MSEAATPGNPRLFINLMQAYVLNPLRKAIDDSAAYKSEIAVERDAFKNFIRRVRELDTEPVQVTHQMSTSPTTTQSHQVQDAYRNTVLAVNHYDEVYGEPLLENAVAELGPDTAAILAPGTGVALTPVAKRLLLSRSHQCMNNRKRGVVNVTAEQESLEAHQNTLRELVGGLNGTVVPEWYQEQFKSVITRFLCQRQDHLHERRGNKSGHEWCRYLYQDQNWRYPVLTGAARLCESTVHSSNT